MQDDAISTLRQYRFNENAEQFVKEVHEAVLEHITEAPALKFAQTETRGSSVNSNNFNLNFNISNTNSKPPVTQTPTVNRRSRNRPYVTTDQPKTLNSMPQAINLNMSIL